KTYCRANRGMIPFFKDFLQGSHMKTVLVALFLFSLTSVWAESPSDVVATVNGKKITRGELDDYHQQNLRFVSQRKVTRELSLDDLINRELGIQKALKGGLDKDPVVSSK